MRYTALFPVALCAVSSVLAGCSGQPDAAREKSAPQTAAAPAGQPQVLVIHARDFAFDAPDTVTAGLTTIRLINDGPDYHHAQLIRLASGHSMPEMMDSLKSRQAFPSWATEVGGPNAAGLAGTESQATLMLDPGAYAVLCMIPSAGGTPHFAEGMERALTVLPASDTTAQLPAADMEIDLSDYAFTPSTPFTAGTHVIRFRNTAAQSHEAVFIRLNPGKTPADFDKFVMDRKGDAPAELVGGVTSLAPNATADAKVTFTPGRYAILCFVPDRQDGKPHVMHGMVKEFTIS